MKINMVELKSKVVDYIRLHGPSLPVQLSKQIHSNILFAGAVLSELIANQKIKISYAKIGGSPVYYVPGQESRLGILYTHLNEKEKKAHDLLKENKVLYDKALEPWQRVALRDLKDFANPMQINNEIFWRWYLFSEEEALKIIQESMKQEVLQQMPVKEEPKLEIPIQQELQPKIEIKEFKPEVQIKLEPVQETKEFKVHEKLKKSEKIKKISKAKVKEEFYNILNTYLNGKNIEKIEEIIIKKNKEFELVAKVPSQVGHVRFLIMAKDKKKISDADLSLAHNKAQLKKLPLMFLSNGELTKQAKEYLNNNYLIFEKL